MATSRERRAVYEALKVAVPASFDDAMRRSFLERDIDIDLAKLGMDSLALMEFCIAIELSTGVTLLPAQLAALASTNAVEEFLRAQQETLAGGGA